jgi:hypothetical protein
MTRICWWLVDVVSQLLETTEREAVRGDFAEVGEAGGQALCDLMGLVVRRQTALWADWRPWLALVGLVAPLGLLLSVVARQWAEGSATYAWLYVNNWTWAYLGSPGARPGSRHIFLRPGGAYEVLRFCQIYAATGADRSIPALH